MMGSDLSPVCHQSACPHLASGKTGFEMLACVSPANFGRSARRSILIDVF